MVPEGTRVPTSQVTSTVVRTVVAVVVAATLLLAALLVDRGTALLGWQPPATPPPDAATEPLRLPPDVADPGGYTFMGTRPDGTPVRFDPCRPVHVVVRPDGEPPGGREAVVAALETVGAASGLVFVVDGDTAEAPDVDRPPVDRARYGDRWSPVLVAWSDAAEHPPLAGAIGVAGPSAVDGPGGPRWVSGTVVLDREWFTANLPQAVGARQASAVLQHELAHLVGLGHSADPFSLMSPAYQSVFSYSLSDRAGLARLGGGPCIPG